MTEKVACLLNTEQTHRNQPYLLYWCLWSFDTNRTKIEEYAPRKHNIIKVLKLDLTLSLNWYIMNLGLWGHLGPTVPD